MAIQSGKMNKPLTFAIATALAASAFTAKAQNPDIFGRVDLSLTHAEKSTTIQSGTNKLLTGQSGYYLENNSSFLGFKGIELFRHDIALLYHFETQVEDISGSGNTFRTRNAFIGVDLALGKLLFGRNDTVFKQAEGNLDIFGNSNADIKSLTSGQTRVSDGLWYHSPKMANLLTLNANYLADNHPITADKQYALSMTLGDKNLMSHNFYLAGAYNHAIASIDAVRLVARVNITNFTLGSLWQTSTSKLDDSFAGQSYFANLAYDLNKLKLKAEYGRDTSGLGKYFKQISGFKPRASSPSGLSDIEVESITLGAEYRLYPSTLVSTHYALYEGSYFLMNRVNLAPDRVFSVSVRYEF
jgi:predicted porin